MSTSLLPSWNIEQPPPVPVRRFTVEEYHRLGEAGILTENDRVELLEGWIVPKMIHNPQHDNCIEFTDEAIRPHLRSGWRIRIQSAIVTPDSEPEPDLAVIRGSGRSRPARHPQPEEIGLIVEVADTSLETDRGTKARLYARANIPLYWIVNLLDRRVEVHGGPSGPGQEPVFRQKQMFGEADTVPLVLDRQTLAHIPVKDLLP